jgi:hypothetical protein
MQQAGVKLAPAFFVSANSIVISTKGRNLDFALKRKDVSSLRSSK